MRYGLRFFAVAIACAQLMGGGGVACAQTTVWKGGTGAWGTAANWNAGVPSVNIDAHIDNLVGTNSVVNLSANSAARNLTVDTGDRLNLLGFGFTVNGTSVANNGIIVGGPGVLRFASSGTFSGNGTVTTTALIETIAGSITNSLPHTIRLQSAGPGAWGAIEAWDIVNNGTIVADSGAQSHVLGDTITNNGLLQSNGGSFSLRAPTITHNGVIQVVNNGSLVNLNVDGYEEGVTVTGSGRWDIVDGGLNALGQVHIQTTGDFRVAGTGVAGLGSGSSLSASVIHGNGAISSPDYTLTILQGDATKPFSGTLGTSVNLIKRGSGTQVITSDQFYLGDTTIEAGVLEVRNPSASGSGVGFGNLNVENGGTFAGTGSAGGFTYVKNGGTLSPGSSGPGTLTFFGLTLEPGSKLDLELSASSSSDFIVAYNAAFTANGVNVKIANHGLQVGTTTWFLDWTGAIQIGGETITPSDFTLVDSPGIAGTFVVDLAQERVGFLPSLLSLPGDYNLDGAVNAADYVVWRKRVNQSVPPGTSADGNGDGTINGADYAVWKTNFGRGASGVGSAEAVPEPGAVLLVVATITAAGLSRRCLGRASSNAC